MRITENLKITDFFSSNVFTDDVMQKYLDEEAFCEIKNVIDNGAVLHRELADKVAEAMKDWAMANGATHYTHWFQPLTGATAEKHDSFISINKKGKTILEFSGKNLMKGETDASSFPSGGIRATFEARGYTVWDCTSPVFIKRSKNSSAILYIPTAFCSYNGEALDKKTPLLRSMFALNREGVRLLNLLGVSAHKVTPNVGGEQEYFLIDKNDYKKRTDLKFCGRTLFGAMPIKGQEQNDQYYAIIKDRVSAFMSDLNEELWRLGITAKTQHNEVAPAQHELAPIFATANIATDHNQIIMDSMKKIADANGLACLLHEKPFEYVNGSGKHNNWSMCTETGKNLLKPGDNPSQNTVFLICFLAVISAVDNYADLVRMSASVPGNDLRLGGHEAPPPIISIYIGDDLKEVLDNIENGQYTVRNKINLMTGLGYLSELTKDTSDRNRTSPFAFTGNKFEFRMVGSSATLSTPNIVLNTIVADAMRKIADKIENFGDGNREEMLFELIKELYKEHKRVVFNGNNYTKDWQKEAKRRGLCQIGNCVDAYDVWADKKNIELFEEQGVLSRSEMTIRKDIYLENYVKIVNTEAVTMLRMTQSEILPALIEYQGKVAVGLNEIRKANENLGGVNLELLKRLDDGVSAISYQVAVLKQTQAVAQRAGDVKKQAILYRDQVVLAMEDLRKAVDSLEEFAPHSIYPFPNYNDILFYE